MTREQVLKLTHSHDENGIPIMEMNRAVRRQRERRPKSKGSLDYVGYWDAMDIKEKIAGLAYGDYGRESTVAQESGAGPENADAAYDRIIKKCGLVDANCHYFDMGISGTSGDREAFQRMVQDGIDGKYKLLLVLNISRFMRWEHDAWTNLKSLMDAGVWVYFISEGIIAGQTIGWEKPWNAGIAAAAESSRDKRILAMETNVTRIGYSCPSGQLPSGMVWSAAGSGGTSKRTGRKFKSWEGKTGRDPKIKIPWRESYYNGRPGKIYYHAFKKFHRGERNISKIAAQISDMGYRVDRTGARWSYQSLLRAMRAKSALGIATFRKGREDEKEVQIIPSSIPLKWWTEFDDWYSGKDKTVRNREVAGENVYIFRKPSRCGSCGARYTGNTAVGRAGKMRGRDRAEMLVHDRGVECTSPQIITEATLEAGFYLQTLRIGEMPDDAGRFIAAYIDHKQKSAGVDYNATRRGITATLARLEESRQRALEEYEDGKMSKERRSAEEARVAAKVAVQLKALAGIPANLEEPTSYDIVQFGLALKEFGDPATSRSRKREIVEMFVQELVITHAGSRRKGSHKRQETTIDWSRSTIWPRYQELVSLCLMRDSDTQGTGSTPNSYFTRGSDEFLAFMRAYRAAEPIAA